MAVRKLTCAGEPCVESADGESIEYRIQQQLADNNAGNISAADVRENLIDIVDSIIENVASGDFSHTGKPFKNNLYIRHTTDPTTSAVTGGMLIVDSGVRFDTDESATLGLGTELARTQFVPYPGPGSISHAQLEPNSLIEGNPHPQYVAVTGDAMFGNLAMGGYGSSPSNWISSKGELDTTQTLGIKFVNDSPSAERVVLGSGTTLEFDKDNSRVSTAASTAHAWIRFKGDATTPTVNSSYNIKSLKRVGQGKYEIYFKDDVRFSAAGLGDYVVVAHSNGTGADGSIEDMDVVNAASVARSGHVFSLAVQSDNGQYIDAALNDVVVFGIASGVNDTFHAPANVI
mgnify:FL=1|tara:strand:+ start:527 stop:1561 length:1035 start_codon:yes stop_codon:yes gene_type:complete